MAKKGEEIRVGHERERKKGEAMAIEKRHANYLSRERRAGRRFSLFRPAGNDASILGRAINFQRK